METFRVSGSGMGNEGMKENKIKMTKQDRKYFEEGMKKATPNELLFATDFIGEIAEKFTKEDLKFMRSCAGRRAERLLKNVVENFSFEDKPDTTGGEII